MRECLEASEVEAESATGEGCEAEEAERKTEAAVERTPDTAADKYDSGEAVEVQDEPEGLHDDRRRHVEVQPLCWRKLPSGV